MLILAIDTTTRDGSLAVINAGQVLATIQGEPSRTHAERLPGAIGAVLDPLGRRLADITLFAVAAGPGSLTGLRIGMATVQGLAFALDRPVVSVPVLDTLAVVAQEWWDQGGGADWPANGRLFLGACLDARRGELFTALWAGRLPGATRGAGLESDPIAALAPVELASVAPPEEIFARWARLVGRDPLVLAGDGALTYGDLARAAVPHVRVARPLPPLAPVVARLAAARVGSAGPPHAVRPVYVRRPDAELARDRAGRPAGGTVPRPSSLWRQSAQAASRTNKTTDREKAGSE